MLVQHKQRVQQSNDKENQSNRSSLYLNYYHMIPVQKEHINQDILKNRIESLEAGYIDSLITLIED